MRVLEEDALSLDYGSCAHRHILKLGTGRPLLVATLYNEGLPLQEVVSCVQAASSQDISAASPGKS